MDFKIEKNIPIFGDRFREYGFEEMKFGDNKFFPCKKDERKKLAYKIRANISTYKMHIYPKKTNWTVRVEDDGVRLWRLG